MTCIPHLCFHSPVGQPQQMRNKLGLNSAPGDATVSSLFLCKKLRKSKHNQCRLPIDNQLNVHKIKKKKKKVEKIAVKVK